MTQHTSSRLSGAADPLLEQSRKRNDDGTHRSQASVSVRGWGRGRGRVSSVQPRASSLPSHQFLAAEIPILASEVTLAIELDDQMLVWRCVNQLLWSGRARELRTEVTAPPKERRRVLGVREPVTREREQHVAAPED